MTGPLITLSPGPRNAFSRDGLRFYRWRGVDYPSVTTIRRMAGLPFGLHNWTLSQVIDRAVLQHEELVAILERPRKPRERVRDKNVVKEARSWLRGAATEKRDVAAALGTAIHDAATSAKRLVDVDPELRPRLLQYYDWVEDSGVTILAVEKQVFNLRLGYAGTFDILGAMPDGTVWVIDLKTGRATYSDHALQLIAYSMAEFVGEDDKVDIANTKLLEGASGMALLHLRETGWEWQVVRPTPRLFKAFGGLLDFATFEHEHSDINSLLSDHWEGSATAP